MNEKYAETCLKNTFVPYLIGRNNVVIRKYILQLKHAHSIL